MAKYVTYRPTCEKHGLDKSIMFTGDFKDIKKRFKTIVPVEMKKLGCEDYITSQKAEELVDG